MKGIKYKISVYLLFLNFLFGAIIYQSCGTSNEIVQGDFAKQISIKGTKKKLRNEHLTNAVYYINSFLDSNSYKILKHQVVINYDYSGHKMFNFSRAYGEKGDEFKLSWIKNKIYNCSGPGLCEFSGIIAISIPKGYLEQYRKGFKIKIFSKGINAASFPLTVDSAQINNQLTKINNSY